MPACSPRSLRRWLTLLAPSLAVAMVACSGSNKANTTTSAASDTDASSATPATNGNDAGGGSLIQGGEDSGAPALVADSGHPATVGDGGATEDGSSSSNPDGSPFGDDGGFAPGDDGGIPDDGSSSIDAIAPPTCPAGSTMETEPNDTMGEANAFSGTACGTIASSADVDWWSFTLATTAKTVGIGFSGNVHLAITVGSTTVDVPGSTPLPFTPGATYYVEVVGNGGATGGYRINESQ